MKNRLITIALILFTYVSFANEPVWFRDENPKINKLHNDYVYLYRHLWHYMEKELLDSLVVCQLDPDESVSIIFNKTLDTKEEQFEAVFRLTNYEMNEVVSKFLIYTETGSHAISINTNTILSQTDVRLRSLAEKQLKFFLVGNKLQHERSDLTFGQRIDIEGIDYNSGYLAENISWTRNLFHIPTPLELVKHNLRGYYNKRDSTRHWFNHMNPANKYYNTYSVYDGYSLFVINIMMDKMVIK